MVGIEDQILILGSFLHGVFAGSAEDVHNRASCHELRCEYWKAIFVLGKMCKEWVKDFSFVLEIDSFPLA